jgi:signal transduction histidine kinase
MSSYPIETDQHCSSTAPAPSKLKTYQTVSIALGLVFFTMVALYSLELIVFKDLTSNQLSIMQWINAFSAATAGILFMCWTMQRKERELVDLRDNFHEMLSERTAELHVAVATNQVQIQNHDALKNDLIKQREDFVLALKLRLKTPLQAAEMTLNHLLEGEYGALTDEQKEIINLLVENNQDVNRLVVMLVTLYRYRNGKAELQMSRHQVSELLASTDQSLKGKARLRHIAVRYECPGDDADIECDAKEIQTLLNHLLENAIKYANSEVVLRCSRQNNYLQISVEDDGCGLPTEDIEALFERFHYVSQSGKYSPTTGVGLCLCAEIAKAHGGTINCESTVGQGAKFTVSLPVVTK